ENEVPEWLATKIAEFEARPAGEAPVEIWRITHRGQPAYYFISPCCDAGNPLFSASGEEICYPDGGFSGHGDGKCPAPRDSYTDAVLVWAAHPAVQPRLAPTFGKDQNLFPLH